MGFLEGFLGTLAGGGVLVLLLKFFGGEYIKHQLSKALADHEHELNVKLATLQGGMSRLGDVLSRRNEREFAVTEKAWELMIEAFGIAQGQFSQGKEVPVFRTLPEGHALKVIAKLPFDDEQKEELRQANADTRDELYEQFELTRGYLLSHKLWVAFKNYVSTHEIFFAQNSFERFVEIRNDLYGVIVHVERFVGPDAEDFDTPNRREVHRDLMALDEKVKALAILIRERFGFSER